MWKKFSMKMDYETPRPRLNQELRLLEALKEKQHHRDRYRETRVEAGGLITDHITLMKSTDFIMKEWRPLDRFSGRKW